MSEEHKRVVQRLVEAMAAGDAAAIESVLDPYYAHYGPLPSMTGRVLPAQGMQHYFVGIRDVFPDFELRSEDVIAEGDKVAVRWTARGTHRGEFLGVAPTCKGLTWTGVTIFRIGVGRIVEGWWTVDAWEARNALGLTVPARPASVATGSSDADGAREGPHRSTRKEP